MSTAPSRKSIPFWLTVLALVSGLASSLTTNIGSLIWVAGELTHAPSPPAHLDFFFVAFWGAVSATVGGVIWWTINHFRAGKWPLKRQRPPYAGGEIEPHREAAIAWAVVTTVPIVVTVVLINHTRRFASGDTPSLLYIGFLLGCTLGAMLFYDGPRLDTNGFRRRMSDWSRHRPYLTEFILAIVWSAIIATFAFIIPLATRVAVSHELTTGGAIASLLERVALCVALTVTAVAVMLIAAPLREPFLMARGIAAGLFLRLGLFFGLVLILV